jgi:hypothetical protein
MHQIECPFITHIALEQKRSGDESNVTLEDIRFKKNQQYYLKKKYESCKDLGTKAIENFDFKSKCII